MHAHTSVMLEPMSAAWPASSSVLVCATADSRCLVSWDATAGVAMTLPAPAASRNPVQAWIKG